jgi:3-oxoacyl-[acyl-carrier protein] reductase
VSSGRCDGAVRDVLRVADTPEERERFAKTVPLRRMSTPEDVASAALYLASDEASFVTGINMPVDGDRLSV